MELLEKYKLLARYSERMAIANECGDYRTLRYWFKRMIGLLRYGNVIDVGDFIFYTKVDNIKIKKSKFQKSKLKNQKPKIRFSKLEI